MIEAAGESSWFVKRDADASPEAIIDRFGGGYRLRRFSLTEARRTPHGVYMSVDLAETAWWRLRDQKRR